MATDRTKFTLRCGLARSSAGVELREPPGLSDGDRDAGRRGERTRRRGMRLPDPARAPTRTPPQGLPAPALGDLGLRHRIAGPRLRGRRNDNNPSRFSVAWLFPA